MDNIDVVARDAYFASTPCQGRKLLLAVPSYGPIDPACQKDVRVAMMVASNHGVRWAGDSSPDRMGWGVARNAAAGTILDMPNISDDDGIVWIDSDMRIPPEAIASLIVSAVVKKADFVTGVYHQRKAPHAPLFGTYVPDKGKYAWVETYEENVFAPCDGCGFGFVFTSRRAIKAIAGLPNFTEERGWFPDERHNDGLGEDLSFCYQAMKAGIQLYVHTGIQLGHVGDSQVITRADFIRELKAKVKEREHAVQPA